MKLNKKAKPTWIRTYNFMSLLNLPAAMKMYGPLVNLWEGKLMGEAIIKHCKSELENGLRGNWAMNVLLKHYRKRALKRLAADSEEDDPELQEGGGNASTIEGKGEGAPLEADGSDDLEKGPGVLEKEQDGGGGDDLTQKRKGRRAFKRYDSFVDVQSAFDSGLPLSAINWISPETHEEWWGMVFGTKKEDLSLAILETNPGSAYAPNGKPFYMKWNLTGHATDFAPMQRVGKLLPVLLLPIHKEIPGRKTLRRNPNRKDEERCDYYTVVSSEWKHLGVN